MRDVRPERSHWRDQKLSELHRLWGWDCPAVDIDFLMVEYDYAIPKALIEYKLGLATEVNENSASMKALAYMANCAGMHFYLVKYKIEKPYQFDVYPQNNVAKTFLSQWYKITPVSLNHTRYYSFLSTIRKRQPAQQVLDNIKEHDEQID